MSNEPTFLTEAPGSGQTTFATLGNVAPERPSQLSPVNAPVNEETGGIQSKIVETRSEEQSEDEITLTRTFKATAGSAAALSMLINSVGVSYGAPHPDNPQCLCISVSYDEEVDEATGDRPVNIYTATLKGVYRFSPNEGEVNPDSPLARGDTWAFQTQSSPIAALFYFENDTLKPLANSAGDPIKGLQVDEAYQKITKTGARRSFPSYLAASLTNCTNSDTFLGFPPGHVKCQGITAVPKKEVVNKVHVTYYEVTVELLARQTGWNLLIPDVGYNFLEGGQKKRCKVKAPDGNGGEVEVASADPVALNGEGGQANGAPAILSRQIYRRVPFNQYF